MAALERRSVRLPGSRAKALLQQLSRSSSRAGALRVPMYDEEGVRLVLGECGALYEQIRDLMGDDHKPIEQVPDAVKVALTKAATDPRKLGKVSESAKAVGGSTEADDKVESGPQAALNPRKTGNNKQN